MDIKSSKNSGEVWKQIEEKAIKMTSKQINIKEPRVRLAMEQIKHKNILCHSLKYARQKKRISVKKMAEKLKASEAIIKEIESEKITNFPLGAITSYLNELGCVLTFRVVDFSRKKHKEPNNDLDILDLYLRA